MMALRVGKDLFDYINEVKVQKSRQAMKRRVKEYVPNQASVDKLERVDEKFYLIIFSADWCADCVAHVPGLAKTLVLTKNNMLTARVVDYDGYRDLAEEYIVRAIPTLMVFEKRRRGVGRFVEMPHRFGTVEEELCAILDS